MTGAEEAADADAHSKLVRGAPIMEIADVQWEKREHAMEGKAKDADYATTACVPVTLPVPVIRVAQPCLATTTRYHETIA